MKHRTHHADPELAVMPDPELVVIPGLRVGNFNSISIVPSSAALRRIVTDKGFAGCWSRRIVQRSAAVEEVLLLFLHICQVCPCYGISRTESLLRSLEGFQCPSPCR